MPSTADCGGIKTALSTNQDGIDGKLRNDEEQYDVKKIMSCDSSTTVFYSCFLIGPLI